MLLFWTVSVALRHITNVKITWQSIFKFPRCNIRNNEYTHSYLSERTSTLCILRIRLTSNSSLPLQINVFKMYQ
jgi:hypothetical protein